ncbi:MAG: hypothetical protein PVJ02_12090, partial [Gemmatimonadota bacterium]
RVPCRSAPVTTVLAEEAGMFHRTGSAGAGREGHGAHTGGSAGGSAAFPERSVARILWDVRRHHLCPV